MGVETGEVRTRQCWARTEIVKLGEVWFGLDGMQSHAESAGGACPGADPSGQPTTEEID